MHLVYDDGRKLRGALCRMTVFTRRTTGIFFKFP